MSICEKDIREYEERHKKFLYGKIGKLISNQSEMITKLGKIREYVDIDTDIPNIGITVNNKLNELSQIFKKAGISMFAEQNVKYDFVSSNFVGDAIIDDMISNLSRGLQAISEYIFSIEKATKKKLDKLEALENQGPINKLFSKIRSFFVLDTNSDILSYSQDEIGKIESYLSEYKEIDERLWKYNLRNNVVQSLVNFMHNTQYQNSDIVLLEERVVPTLQKLGLEDVIPQLKEELNKSQEQSTSANNKSWELSTLQKLGIQISSERIAKESDIHRSDTIDKEDLEHFE